MNGRLVAGSWKLGGWRPGAAGALGELGALGAAEGALMLWLRLVSCAERLARAPE